MIRRVAAGLGLAVALVAAPPSALAADTTPPRVSSVALSAMPDARVDMCLFSSSNPIRSNAPFLRLRLSEPATVTLTPLSLLGRAVFGSVTADGTTLIGRANLSLPAGSSTLQFRLAGGVDDEGTLPVPVTFGGDGVFALLITARDAADNRTLLPVRSNALRFGFSGGMGSPGRWPCVPGDTQQSRTVYEIARATAKLFGRSRA